MVQFKIRINPQQRVAYIPQEIFVALGSKVKAIPNSAAVLLFPENLSLTDVLRSLEIIHSDLVHAEEIEKRKGSVRQEVALSEGS